MEIDKIAEIKLILKTFPSLVPDENETDDQFEKRWERFDSLPDNVKDKLSAKQTSDKIQQIGKVFNIELIKLRFIAKAVRNFYFGNLGTEDLPSLLSLELGLDITRTKEISQQVVDKIINDRSIEIARQANLVNLTLQEAVKNFPELGEQLITLEKITLKNFPEPVRPSIKNWLADYTFTLGHGKRGTVERGRYLFQNPNTGKLKSEERQRLSYILNAFDENVPVTINKNTKQIVFPSGVAGAQGVQAAAPLRQAQPTSPSIEKGAEPDAGVHFSYSQKMPYEGNKLQPQRIVPLERAGYPPAKQDDRTLGKNVVNLKEL